VVLDDTGRGILELDPAVEPHAVCRRRWRPNPLGVALGGLRHLHLANPAVARYWRSVASLDHLASDFARDTQEMVAARVD